MVGLYLITISSISSSKNGICVQASALASGSAKEDALRMDVPHSKKRQLRENFTDSGLLTT